MMNRRYFGWLGAVALSSGRRFLRAAQAPLTWAVRPESGVGSERWYRADAHVILLGITVFRHIDVGDGWASWRESTQDDGSVLRLLEFTGRSAPERAAGLNRFGFIQELSRSGEAIYFGLMTSSPEESAAEAKAALRSQSKDAWYSAIDGRTYAGGIETANALFQAPARTSIEDRQQLIGQARQALSTATRSTTVAQGSPLPFLHALASLLNNARNNTTQYAYNGRLYGLKVERSRDPNTKGIMKVNGNLRRLDGGKPVEFRLWMEEGASHPLPLRIEYQPKSYLRLTFEARKTPPALP
jgi:hypothetical protein